MKNQIMDKKKMNTEISVDFIKEVDEKIRLKEGKTIIEKALRFVHFNDSVSTQVLAKELLLPIPVVTALKKECIKIGVWKQHNGISATEKGKDFFAKFCGFEGIDEALYLEIIENKEKQKQVVKELCTEYSDIFQKRPIVDVTIDQAKCTIETAFRRAMLCLTEHSLIGKRILCVGDDDFVSIALALLVKKLFPNKEQYSTEVGVFEVDERYIQLINELAQQHSLPIKCYPINLKNPIPMSALNHFDCFFTDPPYTVEGAALFLSRGIDALKWERGLKVFLSFANKPVNGIFTFQKCIQQHGLAVRRIYPSFNEYEGASILGSIGQMLVLETTDQTKSIIPKEKPSNRAIYTREKRLPDSVYICRNCKKNIPLGKGKRCLTIEELKEKGCPSCGQKIFDKLIKKHIDNDSSLSKPLGRHIIADFYGCQTVNLHDTKKFVNIC